MILNNYTRLHLQMHLLFALRIIAMFKGSCRCDGISLLKHRHKGLHMLEYAAYIGCMLAAYIIISQVIIVCDHHRIKVIAYIN